MVGLLKVNVMFKGAQSIFSYLVYVHNYVKTEKSLQRIVY